MNSLGTTRLRGSSGKRAGAAGGESSVDKDTSVYSAASGASGKGKKDKGKKGDAGGRGQISVDISTSAALAFQALERKRATFPGDESAIGGADDTTLPLDLVGGRVDAPVESDCSAKEVAMGSGAAGMLALTFEPPNTVTRSAAVICRLSSRWRSIASFRSVLATPS